MSYEDDKLLSDLLEDAEEKHAAEEQEETPHKFYVDQTVTVTITIGVVFFLIYGAFQLLCFLADKAEHAGFEDQVGICLRVNEIECDHFRHVGTGDYEGYQSKYSYGELHAFRGKNVTYEGKTYRSATLYFEIDDYWGGSPDVRLVGIKTDK